MNRTYMVIYERIADDNWGGWTPDIGGAVGAGDSLPAARESLREGIRIQLTDLAEHGLKAPAALAKGFDFTELDPDPSGSHYEIEWETVSLPSVVENIDRRQAA